MKRGRDRLGHELGVVEAGGAGGLAQLVQVREPQRAGW